MRKMESRIRLLAGSALGLGMTVVAAAPAQAQCVLTATTLACDSTTTADTINVGALLSTDRAYTVAPGTTSFAGAVSAGSTVDGFGLAVDAIGSGSGIAFANNGLIQVDAGNLATVTGSAALTLWTDNGDINYSGSGDILNLGTAGSGTWFQHSGEGNITAVFGGDVVGSANYTGIYAEHLGTAGDINVTTAAGTTVSGGYVGIDLEGGPTSTGNLSLTNNAAIRSVAGDTLEAGLVVETEGLGDVNLVNNGMVGSADDRILDFGILAGNFNAASDGAVSISGTGNVFSADFGIVAFNAGTGSVGINYTGTVDSTGSVGVYAESTGGNIAAATGSITSAEAGVVLAQGEAAGEGSLSLAVAGDVSAGTDAIIIDNAGTGAIAVNVAGSVSADAGDAIQVTADNVDAGAISVTTAAGETIAASGGDGIDILTAGSGNVTVTNAANILSGAGGAGTLGDGIIVASTGTGNIAINNLGSIGAADDQAQLTGITAMIDNVDSAAAISINGTGDLNAVGNGIDAMTTGTGNIAVVYGGDVTSDAARAVSAVGTTGAVTITTAGAVTATVDGSTGVTGESTTGALNITANGAVAASGAGSAGIEAMSMTGNQAIALNANVSGETGLVSSTEGTRTITVGAAGSVDGADQAIQLLGTGATTITNAGRIGAAAGDLAIAVADDADITLVNGVGGVINGSITLGAADDTITNAGTINAGTLDFGAGADLLTNQAGGVLSVAGATPILGLETLNNAGTINAATGLTFDAGNTALANTGTINLAGALDLGAGTDSFANTGAGVLNLTANSSIVGAETFTQSGRINLNAFTLTGPAVAFTNTGTLDTSGNAGLAGFTSFSNAGTLDLAPGTFTVPAAVFANTGTILADEGAATITGQTSFANSGTIDLQDGATGDVLTINSAFVGSGGSNLLVDFNDTAADRLVLTGAASGTTTVNATFGGTGLLNLDGVLVVDGTTASSNAFVLGTVGGNTSALVDYSLVQNAGDFLLVSAPNASAFDPLAVTGFGRSLWYQSADEVIAQTRLPAATVGASFWGQVYLSRDKMDNGSTQVLDGVAFDVDQNLRTKRRGIQLGFDYGFAGGRVGVTGGYARAKADNRGIGDVGLKANGWNIGAYGQFGGFIGLHGELLAKHDRYNLDFNSGLFDGEGADARANGIDGSVGYRFGFGGAATLDANAGVSFVRTKFDDVDAFGFNYDLGTIKSTRGRAGLRATFGGVMAPYIDGTVYREFRGDGRVALFDGANVYGLETEGKATWFRIEGGILPNPTGLILAAWADLGDKKGIGARLGYRFGGAAVAAPAAAPLPAPPPVAAPPATQTCADGSVILATDSCPLPPPPPPPPPPAPERG